MHMFCRAIGGDGFYDGDSYPILQIIGIFIVTAVFLYILCWGIGPKPIPTVDARSSPNGYLELIEKAKDVRC